MTLQELLRKSSFTRAFDYITRIDLRAKGSKFCFQTAWEYLCQMKAQPGYQVEIRERTQPLDTAPDINVACPKLDGYPWKMAMGGEVMLAPEIADAPTDMIAAVSLYELTYYGFSPDERRKFPERMFGKPNPSDGPNEDDLLSEETKALCPDLDEYFDRSDEEYDKQYALYSEYVIRELKALADGGNKYGQFYLGKAYGEGSYGLEIDKAEAFRLFKESADQGFFKAQNNLAQCYQHGFGTAKDIEKAKELYEKASEAPRTKGYPEENLAHIFLDEGNKEQAIVWFKKAASKGNVVCKQYSWYLELDAPKWT